MSYECASVGGLKLKGVMDKSIKKKKKKTNDKLSEKVIVTASQNTTKSDVKTGEAAAAAAANKSYKTKAELLFEKRIEQRNEEKILKRAEKSHKEHVESFNRHLESLSEYNDVPKVSWTK
jgi:protein FAM32A